MTADKTIAPDAATEETFTLTNNKTGDTYELPVMHASHGPSVIDVRTLYAETDHFTFDPSYTSTASCKSRLTFIDGDKGVLLHRGYTIEDLTEKASFLEVAHLLLYGTYRTLIAKLGLKKKHLSHDGA